MPGLTKEEIKKGVDDAHQRYLGWKNKKIREEAPEQIVGLLKEILQESREIKQILHSSGDEK